MPKFPNQACNTAHFNQRFDRKAKKVRQKDQKMRNKKEYFHVGCYKKYI